MEAWREAPEVPGVEAEAERALTGEGVPLAGLRLFRLDFVGVSFFDGVLDLVGLF